MLVRVKELVKYFPVRSGILSRKTGDVHAVDNVTFDIRKGEVFGLVGESGCGKTTLGMLILRLTKPTAGKVFFEERDLFSMSRREMHKIRREMQVVFQDPFASLDPRMNIKQIISEPMVIHGIASGTEREKRVKGLLRKVGLEPDYVNRHPHEFSGGQRQRVAIARALAVDPKFVILDEPTSMLDVSVQAQILNDLRALQREKQLTILFISHDLAVIDHICDRIAVMYLGKIVELASKYDLCESPLHPYSRALHSTNPVPNPEIKRKRILLKGEVPSPTNVPAGCRFHPRCSYVMDVCRKIEPQFMEIESNHFLACHLKR